MSGQLQIKSLGAFVKVKVTNDEGAPVYRVVGVDETGKPVTEQATRLLSLHRGDPLPDGIAAGEVERLQAQDAVGTAEEVAAVGARVLEGATPEAGTAPASPDLANLAAMSDADLAALYESGSPPTVPALVDAVGNDPALARRVLDAENARTKGDPRKSLVEQLEKVTEAA